MSNLARPLLNETKKTKTIFHKATDTFQEVALIFVTLVTVGGAAYALFEGKNILDGIWWAFVTAFTVGYGDAVPGTVAGRVVAIALMSLSVFFVIPLITALLTKRAIVDDDAWTNPEQEYLMATLERMNDYIDKNEPPVAKPKVSKPKTVKSGKIKATRAK